MGYDYVMYSSSLIIVCGNLQIQQTNLILTQHFVATAYLMHLRYKYCTNIKFGMLV